MKSSKVLRSWALLTLACLAISSSSCARKQQSSEGPSQWGNGPSVGKLDLLSVAFAGNWAWAVGDIDPSGAGGAIFRSTDDGQTWSALARTEDVLASACFIDRRTGWVAGYSGTIERTDDGGASWALQRGDRPDEILNSIYFADASHGWAVGGGGLVLRTEDGGKSWEPIVSGRVEDLWCVRFITNGRGWAVGEDGLILSSDDGGRSWSPSSPRPQISSSGLFALTVTQSGSVVAVGESGTIIRSTDGKNWSLVPSGTTEPLNSVSCPIKNEIWAAGAKGAVLESSDDGVTWQQVPSFSSKNLMSIGFSDSKHGIGVGQRGYTAVYGPR